MASRTYGYLENLFISVDQLINSIFGGSCEETISAVCWRWHADGIRSWPYYLINMMFFWQSNHCYGAYVSEVERRQLGDAYKNTPMGLTISEYCRKNKKKITREVVRANLRGESNDWVFKDTTGAKVEYLVMDEKFLTRVRDGNVQFTSGKKLKFFLFDNIWIFNVEEVDS